MVAEYLSKNITVFADENQKLNKENSTLEDIRLYSGINGNIHKLRRNYRNTRQIASWRDTTASTDRRCRTCRTRR